VQARIIVQEDSRNLISHYARRVAAAADSLKDVSVGLDRLMALVPVLVLEA